MTDFITDTYKEDEKVHYKLIFNTLDREVFDAMQALARRMVDRQEISTNYEYICTRTPKELAYILAGIVQECDEQAVDKLRQHGIEITRVSLAPELQAQIQLMWLNKSRHCSQEEDHESDTNPNIE